MKRIFLFFTIIIVAYSAKAQTFTGKVIGEDSAPIEFANVLILAKDSTFIAGGVTNINGAYEIYIQENNATTQIPYLLKINAIGYDDKILQLASLPQKEAVIVLNPKGEELNKIVVTGKRKSFTLNDRGVFVAKVAEVEALKNSGSIEDLLNQIPFVQGKNGTFYVLGTEGAATLYLDGHRVQDASILQRLRSQDIVTVEVNNTPGARYNSKVKSIIEIRTKKRENNTSVAATQMFQLQRKLSSYSGVNLAHSTDKLYFDFNMAYSYTAVENKNRDYYSLSSGGNLYETIKEATVGQNNDLLMGGANLNYSKSDKTNLGATLNFNFGVPKFNTDSPGLRHYENGAETKNTAVTSRSKAKPIRSMNSLYYNSKIGSTKINVTDEFLVGGLHSSNIYREVESGSFMDTKGKRDYLMNSLILSLNSPIGKVEFGYGGEFSLSYNSSDFRNKEGGIDSEVADSKIKNTQSLLAAFSDVRYKVQNFVFYGGLRYEYAYTSYKENDKPVIHSKIEPHFLSPTLSISYAGKKVRATISFKRTLDRPAYSALGNGVSFENPYVYQQGNPFQLNQISNITQLVLNYKTLSFNTSYNIIQDAPLRILTKYPLKEGVILKRTENLPNYSKFTFGANWRGSYGFYSPSVSFSYQQQFLKYDGRSFNTPMVSIMSNNYFNCGKGWRAGFYAGYTSRRNNMLSVHSDRWNYRVMASKQLKNFTIDFNMNNLFINNKLSSSREMNGIVDRTIEDYDSTGVSLTISYRFNSVRAKYRNRVNSNESKRF